MKCPFKNNKNKAAMPISFETFKNLDKCEEESCALWVDGMFSTGEQSSESFSGCSIKAIALYGRK